MKLIDISIIISWILLSTYVKNSFCEKTIPSYECDLSSHGTNCGFDYVTVTLENYKWIPIARSPSSVTEVTFEMSTIPVLTDNICRKFPSMTKVELGKSGIQKIKENAFETCENLEILLLYGNQIEELDENLFAPLKNLQKLYINYNKIVHLNINLFASLHNLTRLSVGNNNLTEFPSNLLRNNAILEDLRIQFNALSDVNVEEIHGYAPNLTQVVLNDNDISCKRLEDIFKFFEKEDIQFYHETSWNTKIRDYEPQVIRGKYNCKPDMNENI